MSDLQYARETEAMLAQQRKENRSNMFILCPHVQVIFAYCFFSFYIIHYIVVISLFALVFCSEFC